MVVHVYFIQKLFDLDRFHCTYSYFICSCLAVNDLLRGRQLDDVVEQLPELWENCLRVRDDIKVSGLNFIHVF